MMKQFEEMKKKHTDAILLFRCGDFYETYREDAKACAEILGITLTRRNSTKDEDNYEMAGFPYHALDTYLPKLIRSGRRVAICDQIEDPKKPLAKRGITETITPTIQSNNNQTTKENMEQTITLTEHQKRVSDIIKTTLGKVSNIPTSLDSYFAGLFEHRLDYIKIKRNSNIALNDADINYMMDICDKYYAVTNK